MKKTPLKRFIAGAVCPKCGLMDKLVVYSQDDNQYRECVSCGFSERQNFDPKPQELETRVNKTPEQISAETQVLKFPPDKQ